MRHERPLVTGHMFADGRIRRGGLADGQSALVGHSSHSLDPLAALVDVKPSALCPG